MAKTVVGRARRTRLRAALASAYLVVALVTAVALLPTALRPPPDPTSESGALSPDAPPDADAVQLIQSVQQAGGSGAGAGVRVGGGPAGAASTTTLPPPPTTAKARAASGTCFGNPKRQTESVYSPPCIPGFSGSNGGSTAHNVLPNEVRLSFNHALGAPPDGRVPDQAQPEESSATRTMRVLNTYVNQRFETYGRHIAFYGTATQTSAAEGTTAAATADESYNVFASYDLQPAFCQDMVRRRTVVFCDPQEHGFYTRNRPGMFSWQMDFDQAFGFGAEYLCRKLQGRNADLSGTEQGKPRRFAIVTERAPGFGVPADHFSNAFATECGGTIAQPVELASNAEPAVAAAAVQRFRTDGITTIVLNTGNANTLSLMTAAGASYVPEWIVVANQGLDLNVSAQLMPAAQSSHLFGISGWELPHVPQESECFRAYHSVDPDNDPDANTCLVFWHPMNMMLAGIQLAGAKLSPTSFEAALFQLGHRYGQTPWSIGGGYGPDDYSYMDNVGEVWFDPSALAPENGRPGAYRWTFGGARAKRGQISGDTSQLRVSGITKAPPGT
jgi:hypothetical protein